MSLVFLMVVLNLTLNILELMIKSKKRVLSAFNGSFLSILVKGVHRFFNLRGFSKKKFWKPLARPNNTDANFKSCNGKFQATTLS